MPPSHSGLPRPPEPSKQLSARPGSSVDAAFRASERDGRCVEGEGNSLRVTRRGFLLGAATGLAGGLTAGVAGTWLANRHLVPALYPPRAGGPAPRFTASDVMPGRYPGRVIEVRHPRAVSPHNRVNAGIVSDMVDRGMAELTDVDDPRDLKASWGTFFQKGDVVGVKVNPVGKAPTRSDLAKGHPYPRAVGSISSFALVVKVVNSLKALGIPPQDIIVFERYANEFVEAGYRDLVETELPGVRWLCSASGYSNEQLDIAGFDGGRDLVPLDVAPHVVGYDPDVFTVMGYCMPDHSPRDDRRFRSHLSLIVSRMVNKMITLPVLKDHRSAGVTLALKNMSHGMNNNVARSHLSGIAHGFGRAERVTGPNQCNTFIPQAVAQLRLRQKATLHILDGLIGVYEGGPGCWNRTWSTWRHKGLFFSTDPVALDHVGWDVIDARRAEAGWAPVERMGALYNTPAVEAASGLAPLAASTPLGGATLSAGAGNLMAGRGTESFNVRQPDHVVLAGKLGLGVFDRGEIGYRRVEMGG
jgi:hypothetical protein